VFITCESYILNNKKPESCESGSWFIEDLPSIFYLIIKPEPVSAILFLPVKSEQNITIPPRLDVDVELVNMSLYVFIVSLL
jgi:hypothetical protein